MNVKCDILPFTYTERREEIEGIIIGGEND